MSLRTKIAALDIPFFSGMYHGILSITLGLVLIFDPDKSEPKLTYLMGIFWLASGIALLRQDPGEKMDKRLSQLVSVLAIVTGLLVVLRYFVSTLFGLQITGDPVVNVVLGAVILLTGISHFYAEIELGGHSTSHRLTHYLLAVFEILLGLQLLLLPLVDHLYIRQTIIVWALLGGIMFISTAIYERRQHLEARKRAADIENTPTMGAEQKNGVNE